MKPIDDPGRTFWPALFASHRQDWRTPPELLASLSAEFGPFDLDPACSGEATACAPLFYTPAEDGLAMRWVADHHAGNPRRVFLNPPYSKAIGHWMRKAAREGEAGALVVCLVPARVDTRWWHEWVEPHARLIRFLRGRVKFIGPEGVRWASPFPSTVVVYWGRQEQGIPAGLVVPAWARGGPMPPASWGSRDANQ